VKSIYHKLLAQAIGSRLINLVLVVIGILSIPRDTNPYISCGFVALLGLVALSSIHMIVSYLAMDKLEFIQQIRWERKKN
jgi:hypothetical protein